MIDIGGNNHAAAGHFVADKIGRKLFALRHVDHFFRDQTLAGIVHLGEIAIAILRLAPRDPLRPRPVVSVLAICSSAFCGGHWRHYPRCEMSSPKLYPPAMLP